MDLTLQHKRGCSGSRLTPDVSGELSESNPPRHPGNKQTKRSHACKYALQVCLDIHVCRGKEASYDIVEG